jgi:uncharacterized protein with HEPN domain
MQPDTRDASYLLDMLEAAERARLYVADTAFVQYESNGMLRDAVERNVVVIGEAAKKVSQPFREGHPEIPWRRFIALRNVLAHEYGAVSNAEIWEVVTKHLSALVSSLEPLIPPTPPED